MRKHKHHRSWIRRIPTPVLILIAIAVALLMISAVKTPSRAQDGESSWVYRTYCNQYRTDCYRRRVRAYQPRVYSYERRWNDDEDERSGRSCRDVRRAVGDQHLTLEGAKKASNDAWAGAIRFHLGERFMDLNNARHIAYVCSRSSIKEGGVTTLGQSLTRCELTAQPCAPLAEHEKREEDR